MERLKVRVEAYPRKSVVTVHTMVPLYLRAYRYLVEELAQCAGVASVTEANAYQIDLKVGKLFEFSEVVNTVDQVVEKFADAKGFSRGRVLYL